MTRPLRLPTIRSAPTATIAAVLVTTAALPVLFSPAAAGAAAASCAATYRIVNQWSGGFQADIQVTNTGTVPLTGWRLVWSYDNGEQVSQGWNATVTQDGSTVAATNATFNGNVTPAGSTIIGLLGTGQPDSKAPAVACADPAGAGTPTPSVPPVSPTPSTTPSGPPDAACGNATFCDGFEAQGGTVPDGAWTVSRPHCQGSGTATVDTAVAHSGTRSVRVDGRAGYCNHVFVRPVADLTPVGRTWHVRFYVRHSVPLPGGHVALAALRDDADGGKDLRLGGQSGALQWNRESDDATVPVQSPAGVAQSLPLPTGTWNCVAFAVDGERGTMSTSVNGTQVPGLLVDAVPTADVDAQWTGRTWRPHLTDLRLGWESYGGGDDTLWFDDVAVSAYPLAC
ncbi:cellulose binding domain-containing protein [Micromonospora maritima]|uniref:cellulose binding domain-containing protein n=1 Tax=Micromonospora maritima TaxID=986711 RepID=UPI00157C2684|nr:cellulose binding domain-containing protein [Micromonospora maritima]